MSQSNVDVVKSLYAAFARGDLRGALAAMDSSIVWNEAEGFPYADRNPYVGPTAIAQGVFMRLATEWNQFQAIPEEFLDAGDTIIALGRYKATHKLTGNPLDAQFAHVLRLRDGKITRFQVHRYSASDARRDCTISGAGLEREEVFDQLLSIARQHAFRMELHALDSVLLVPQPHDHLLAIRVMRRR
jgi:ketosteroid isomerase-like protein